MNENPLEQMRRLRERRAAERRAQAEISDTQPIAPVPEDDSDRLVRRMRRPRTALLAGVGGTVLIAGLAITAIPALAGGGDDKSTQVGAGLTTTTSQSAVASAPSTDVATSADASSAGASSIAGGTAMKACPTPPGRSADERGPGTPGGKGEADAPADGKAPIPTTPPSPGDAAAPTKGKAPKSPSAGDAPTVPPVKGKPAPPPQPGSDPPAPLAPPSGAPGAGSGVGPAAPDHEDPAHVSACAPPATPRSPSVGDAPTTGEQTPGPS